MRFVTKTQSAFLLSLDILLPQLTLEFFCLS